MHRLTIEDIQRSTLDLLSRSIATVDGIIEDSDISDEKGLLSGALLKDRLSVLSNEIDKVDELEMVIAVVGTMKAGKSTTINAIVGQEVLPNRSYPMTALPTLVTHKKGCFVPTLSFQKCEPIIAMSREVSKKLKRSGDKKNRGFHNRSEAEEVVAKIIEDGELQIQENYQGQEEIFNFLRLLNDLMRLAKELKVDPPYEEYETVDDFPKIEVEFSHLKESKGDTNGRLSILDTPGPNEYGTSDKFKRIFQNQLSKASAVLLVVDYTQIGSTAGGDVRDEIDKMSEVLINNTYVLLNKFDNHSDRNDAPKEKIIKDFSEQLMKGRISEERIFPVSALSGFLANLILRDLNAGNDIDPEGEWVAEFGEEIMGKRWRKKIYDREEVEASALDGWDDSGFSAPLEKVIRQAHQEAAFKSLESAIGKLMDASVSNGINALLGSFLADVEVISKVIDGAKKDIEQIALVKKTLSDNFSQQSVQVKKDFYAAFEEESEALIRNAEFIFSESSEDDIESMSNSIFDSWHLKESKKALRKLWSKSDITLNGNVLVSSRDIVIRINKGRRVNVNKVQIVNKIRKAIKSLKPVGDDLEFDDKENAGAVIKDVNNMLKSSVAEFNDNINDLLEWSIDEYSNRANQLVDDQVAVIIEAAKIKLGDSGFKVDFNAETIGKVKLGSIGFQGIRYRVQKRQKKTKGKKVGASIFSWFKNLLNDDWGLEECTFEEDVYSVNKSAVITKVKESVGVYKIKIEGEIEDSLGLVLFEIKQQVSLLEDYLEQYRQSMISGLEIQQGVVKDKVKLKKKISTIAKVVNYDKIDIVDSKNQLNQLMKDLV
ncbi:MAG: hypothetical protein HOI42_14550 [Candidatus Marinimicrobia bacterium]|jgi:GTPase SAR1 family protein|nr:hypothetical protein [Candidatus Neomarinimicrobiota bacterium]